MTGYIWKCPYCSQPVTVSSMEHRIECGGTLSESAPPRGPLSPEVERAARTIHRDVWRESYTPGQGPMHHAGGPYWRTELLRKADRWDRLAAAARVCAEALPYE